MLSMNIWLAIALILTVVSMYMFIIEIFSVAFKLTGLATSKIKLQVASLFTGTGFTTAESELIVNDDKRRKIALACIYVGHIFSVAIMGLVINVIFSIVQAVKAWTAPDFTSWYFIVLYISTTLFLIMLFLKIPPINKRFQKLLERIAINSSKHNRKTNIITVLDMYGKHAIAEVVLNVLPPFAVDTPLFEMGINKKYSINILSIKRGKRLIDVSKDTMFKKGDTLIIFGLINDIRDAFVNSLDPKHIVVVEHTNEINLVNNYGANALVEVHVEEVPKELEGVAMKDAHLTDKYSISVGVIKRGDEYLFPDKDTVIEKGDTLSLFGPFKNIKLLFRNEDKQD